MVKAWKFLTLTGLGKLGACSGAVEAFKKRFKSGTAHIPTVLSWIREIERNDWEGWALVQDPGLTMAFLKAGVDVHARDDYALRWASRYGYEKVVELLLKAGADVHADNDYALRWASENGHEKVVKLLLKAGADVHADDDYALRLASIYGHKKVVELLLKAGADVHARDDYALRWASEYGHEKVVKLLQAERDDSSVSAST